MDYDYDYDYDYDFYGMLMILPTSTFSLIVLYNLDASAPAGSISLLVGLQLNS